MTESIKAFWHLLSEECERISHEEFKLALDENLQQEYFQACKDGYDNYKRNYMKKDVKFLDRHKVASILVIEGIGLDIIKPIEDVPSGKVFLGQEKILLANALRFLVQKFNDQVCNAGFKQMDTFGLPQAFSCDTRYDDIMARIQYFAKKKYGDTDARQIAEMELADRFFLLEYISIMNFYKDEAENVFIYLRKRMEES